MKVIPSTSTGGDWSKLIRKNPNDETILISNWRSSDISINTKLGNTGFSRSDSFCKDSTRTIFPLISEI